MNVIPPASASRPTTQPFGKPDGGWRLSLYTIIFEADTVAGRRFDIWLIVAILVSFLVVLLDSVQTIGDRYEAALHALEWTFTLLFTVEYALRLACVRY